MQKVTGVGGVFIKADDPKALAAWYEKYLGVSFEGNTWITFEWDKEPTTTGQGQTVFSFFKNDSDYFHPSEKKFMINFRVSNLFALLDELRKEGVWVDEKVGDYEYGKFGWIMDPEGNRIELWQPA